MRETPGSSGRHGMSALEILKTRNYFLVHLTAFEFEPVSFNSMTAVLRSVQDGGAAALRMGEFVAMERSIEFRLLVLLYSLI